MLACASSEAAHVPLLIADVSLPTSGSGMALPRSSMVLYSTCPCLGMTAHLDVHHDLGRFAPLRCDFENLKGLFAR